MTFALGVSARAADAPATPEGSEFFEKKIRPVLVERCYKCHSATSEKLKGGLRVDSREALIAGGDTRTAIVPGDPAKSLLIEALQYGNNDLQMPPKSKLSDAEIADFVTWIKMGAPWPGGGANTQVTTAKVQPFNLEKRRATHWAWKPIQPVNPPAVKDTAWPISPVDQFLLAKLEAAGLSPAPAADKATLIRRAYFDLIGLPPSPNEVHAFLQDSSPNAYPKLIDRLLASPQFGERWARHWLDLARYAETLGHEFDYANYNAWRYRDYVIRAFNTDLPYNEFVTEQIAGDLLAKPRLNPDSGFNESVIGTGIFWLGQRSHSPVDVRAEEAVVVDNQIDVTAKTFLGLTVACARCHDHKFDAISTRDYYSMFGVFGSSRYAQCALDPPEKLAPTIAALSEKKSALRPLLGAVWLAQATNSAVYLLAAREVISGDASLTLSNRCSAISTIRNLNPTRLTQWVNALAEKSSSETDHPFFAWVKMSSLTNQLPANEFSNQLHSAALALTPSHSATSSHLTNDEPFGNFSTKNFGPWSLQDEAFGAVPSVPGDFVVGDATRPVLAILNQPTANSASVARRLEGTLRSPTFTIQKRYAHLLAAGVNSRLNIRVDNFTMIRDPIYGTLKRTLGSEPLQWITVDLETWKGHRAYFELDDTTTGDPSEEAEKKYNPLAYVALSRVVFSDDSTPPSHSGTASLLDADDLDGPADFNQLAALYQKTIVAAVKDWTRGECNCDESATEIAGLDWLVRHSLLDNLNPDDSTAQQLAATLADFRQLEDAIPERTRALGMIDGTPVDENVFIRGNHKTPGNVVPRRFLEALGGSDTNRFTRGSGRLELAEDMVDPANPLLARVMVNRVWLHLFGRGIVPTPDDFGVLGQPPSNPELLDWLANWYRTDGAWSTKQLIRLLMTSRAYQMSSRPADALAEEKDPQNILLHRMPVRRLEGEAIRDALLSVSGRLDLQMFGPSVPTYIDDFMEGRGLPTRRGPLDGACRRSIYQELRRNFPSPMMRAFDFPVPYTTIGRRTVSNVPAQSLTLMNDPFVIGEATAWAKKLLARTDLSPDQRIRLMYETIFSRPPNATELADALAFLAQQGEAYHLSSMERAADPALWADYCHVLMNVKEFVFLN